MQLMKTDRDFPTLAVEVLDVVWMEQVSSEAVNTKAKLTLVLSLQWRMHRRGCVPRAMALSGYLSLSLLRILILL